MIRIESARAPFTSPRIAFLEESPAPEFEWNRLSDVLGLELLGRLVGISATSVRRYRANARTTPDEVADRLHFLSLVVGDLAGAYRDSPVV